MKKKFLICTIAIGTMLFSLNSCKLDMPKETEVSFETMVVDTSDIVLPVKFSANMKGQSDVTIMPQVSGQLIKICVTEGQQVTKGQTLFIIDQRNAQNEVDAAQANLRSVKSNVTSAQANIESAQANLQSAQAKLEAALASENSAKLEYESNKNLYDKKIVSKYMLDNSQNNYKQAQASVSQARAAVTQARAAVSQAKAQASQSNASVSQAQSTVNRSKVNLGYCTITSPVSGVIGDIPVFEGEQVTPMTKLTIVSSNSVMEAEFSISESMLESAFAQGFDGNVNNALKHAPDVTFVMKNGTEYPHKGRLTSATGMVNAATGTIACKATFPNPQGMLYSGIQGTVMLPVSQNGVMVIPQSAVVRLQDKSLVYMVKPDSTATAISVITTDAGNGKDVIVTSGLNIGDRIVTVGANNLEEGQRVLFPAGKRKK